MTLVYLDDRFLNHRTGQHPESPARLTAIRKSLDESGLLNQVTRCEPESAADEDLLRVHTSDHLAHLRRYAAAGGGRVETDTVMSVDSATVAWLAAGTAIDATDRVLTGPDSTALCLIRPPGHHALPDRPMGFCLLSNAAIAARTAIQKHQLRRVLVVDWDVHHGNGTQDAFYDDENVWFFSAHRYPFYPGTGERTETGSGPGLGTIFNLPLAFGVSRDNYLSGFETMLNAAAEKCRPELIIISAGFDAHREDPIGSLGLETEDFAALTRMVQQVAATWSRNRIVSLLEGGYNVLRLAECVTLHLRTLMESSPPPARGSQIP